MWFYNKDKPTIETPERYINYVINIPSPHNHYQCCPYCLTQSIDYVIVMASGVKHSCCAKCLLDIYKVESYITVYPFKNE